MADDNLSEYLTLKQVSELLKIHPNTLRNWDKNDILKPIRIGERKMRRYKKEDIKKFIEKGEKK